MTKKNKLETSMTIKIDYELAEDFRRVCGKNNLNGSAIIRSFMREYVEQSKAQEVLNQKVNEEVLKKFL